MIVVPVLGVGPSLKVDKNHGVPKTMNALEEQRGSRQPQASSPNTSLQRTVWHKVLARGRAVVAQRPRNNARLAPRTAAELNRYALIE
jgi:hypothetical protein